MIPEIGQIYQKHIVDNDGLRLDRRLILDATNTQVLYQELFEEPTGTIILDAHDPISHQKQIGMKNWRLWAKTATLEGA